VCEPRLSNTLQLQVLGKELNPARYKRIRAVSLKEGGKKIMNPGPAIMAEGMSESAFQRPGGVTLASTATEPVHVSSSSVEPCTSV
jgi:hypothetical protein